MNRHRKHAHTRTHDLKKTKNLRIFTDSYSITHTHGSLRRVIRDRGESFSWWSAAIKRKNKLEERENKCFSPNTKGYGYYVYKHTHPFTQWAGARQKPRARVYQNCAAQRMEKKTIFPIVDRTTLITKKEGIIIWKRKEKKYLKNIRILNNGLFC